MIDKVINFGWMIFPRTMQIFLWIGSAILSWEIAPYFYPLEPIAVMLIGFPAIFLHHIFSVWHDVLHDKDWVKHAREFRDFD